MAATALIFGALASLLPPAGQLSRRAVIGGAALSAISPEAFAAEKPPPVPAAAILPARVRAAAFSHTCHFGPYQRAFVTHTRHTPPGWGSGAAVCRCRFVEIIGTVTREGGGPATVTEELNVAFGDDFGERDVATPPPRLTRHAAMPVCMGVAGTSRFHHPHASHALTQ